MEYLAQCWYEPSALWQGIIEQFPALSPYSSAQTTQLAKFVCTPWLSVRIWEHGLHTISCHVSHVLMPESFWYRKKWCFLAAKISSKVQREQNFNLVANCCCFCFSDTWAASFCVHHSELERNGFVAACNDDSLWMGFHLKYCQIWAVSAHDSSIAKNSDVGEITLTYMKRKTKHWRYKIQSNKVHQFSELSYFKQAQFERAAIHHLWTEKDVTNFYSEPIAVSWACLGISWFQHAEQYCSLLFEWVRVQMNSMQS